MNATSFLALAWTQIWQLSLVVALVAIAVRTICRSRPHWAYALWTLALIKCLTPPVWSSPTGVFSWAALDRPAQAALVETTAGAATSVPTIEFTTPATDTTGAAHIPPAIQTVEIAVEHPVVVDEPASVLTIPRAVLSLWGLGTISALVICGIKIGAIRQQLRDAALPVSPELVDLLGELRSRVGTARRVRLIVSSEPWGPALVGFARPQLVLPSALVNNSSRAELAPIVAHELVHLRRGDHLLAGLQLAAQAIWWFHPLVWWMNHEMNRAREMSCDEEVLASLDCEPANYAQTLLNVVRLRRQLRGASFAPGMRSVQVTAARLGHILAQHTRFHRRTPAACWVVVSLFALVLLPGAGIALSSAAPEADIQENKNAAAESDQPVFSPDGAITFMGTVLDAATKKPLAGATVVIDRFTGRQRQELIETSESVSDAQGKYRVTIPAAQANDATLYLVAGARHPKYAESRLGGYGFAMIKKNLKLGESPFFNQIAMLPGEEVTGVIEDPQGRPVANLPVNVFTVAGEGDPLVTGGWSNSQVRTDTDGRFRYNAIRGGTSEFWVEPKDFAPLVTRVGKKHGEVGRFTLRPGDVVKGRVVDSSGKPVPNVWVNVRPDASELIWSTDADRTGRSVRTDDVGNFQLAPLNVGRYLAYVSDREESASRDKRREEQRLPLPAAFVKKAFEVPATGVAEPLEIRAVPHVTVVAQYVDSAGKPTRGHDQFLHGKLGGQSYGAHARIDAAGRFEAKAPRGLEQAKMELSTDEHSVLRVRRGKDAPLSNVTHLELGTLDKDVNDITIVRYQAPVLVVRVTTPDGASIAGLKPRIDYPAGTLPPRIKGSRWVTGVDGDVSLQPQPDGRWRSSQLQPDQEFTVTVEAPGHQSVSKKLKLPEGETKEIDVQLEPDDKQAKSARGTTTATGTTELGLSAGKGDSPNATTQGTLRAIQVDDNHAATPDATGRATVDERTIVDGVSGKPLAGVDVVVEHLVDGPSGRKLVETSRHVTDSQGKYRIPIPAEQAADPSLALVIDASHPGYAALGRMLYGFRSQRRNQELGNSQRFALQKMYPGEEVTGIILDPQGKPLADLQMHVSTVAKKAGADFGSLQSQVADGESPGGAFLVGGAAVSSITQTRTDAEGRFRFSALKGGTAQFWVDPPKYASLTHSIDKQRGDIGPVRLEPGLRVAGRVVDVAGKPVAGVWINLSSNIPNHPWDTTADRTTRAAQSDGEGAFEFAPVHDGKYVAYVSTMAANDPHARLESGNLPAAFDPVAFDLPAAGLEKPLEIRAVPHASISGDIVDSAGKPVPNAALAINGQRGPKTYTKIVTSDAKGSFDAKVPRDVRRAALSSVGDEEHAFRIRRADDGKLQHEQRTELGALDHDVDGIRFVRYHSPTVWLKLHDPGDQPITNAQCKIAYTAQPDQRANGFRDAIIFPLSKDSWRTIALLPNEELTLSIEAPGYKPISRKLKLAEGTEEKLDLKLDRD